MITTVLIIHIAIAVLTLGLAGGVAWTTAHKTFEKASELVQKMWFSTAWAVFSGFWLGFIAHAPITQVCTSALMLVSVVSVAHLYSRVAVYARD